VVKPFLFQKKKTLGKRKTKWEPLGKRKALVGKKNLLKRLIKLCETWNYYRAFLPEATSKQV